MTLNNKKIALIAGLVIAVSGCSTTSKKEDASTSIVNQTKFCDTVKVDRPYNFYTHHLTVYRNDKKVQDITVAAEHEEKVSINATQKVRYTGRIAEGENLSADVLVDYEQDVGLSLNVSVRGDLIPVLKIEGEISELQGFTNVDTSNGTYKTPNVSKVSFDQTSGIRTEINKDSYPSFSFEHKDINGRVASKDIYEIYVESCPYDG